MSKKITLEKSISILVGIVMLFIIIITISALEDTISTQQDSQIQQLTEVITYQINRTIDVNTLIESYQTKILESTSNELLAYFSGREYSTITTDELNDLLSTYQLSGIALFHDTGEDVIIEKSTSAVEVGLSTNKWGFWYTAFRQLFDDNHVSIDKGTSKNSFWIGPRSKSYEQEGFFLFSYKKVPDQPYLLNLFIDDKKAFNMLNTHDVNSILSKLVQQADFIDEIAIINVDAWNNRFQHEQRSKLQDFTIEYGSYRSFTASDTYYLNRVCDLKFQDSMNLIFDDNGEKKIKRYSKLSDHEVLIFVLNKTKQDAVGIRVAVTAICGLLSVWMLGYLLTLYYNKKFNKILDLEKERLKVAELYKQTVQILPSVVLRLSIIDNKFIVRHCEGQALKLIGVDAQSSRGKELNKFMPAEYIKLISQQLDQIDEGQSSRFEYKFGDRIFENKLEWIHGNFGEDNESSTSGELIILWNDISELRQSEDKARFMAYHDHLTSLPNRRYFKDMVTDTLNSSDDAFYLAFIDLDGFKNVNDSAGHDIGDELLVAVSNRLTKALGKNCIAARMGGDEFAVLFKDIRSRNLLEKALTRIKTDLSKPYTLKEHKFIIGMSIGISQSPVDGNDYVTLLKKADIAMYRVKDAGKGDHQYYNPQMNPHTSDTES